MVHESLTDHVVHIAGRRFSYWSTKTTAGRPLIMLHGHGGDHRGLSQFASLFNRTVYIPDLPGFGDSDELPDHSIESYVVVLKQFVDTLGIKDYDLLGHSLGSAIALALAADDKRVHKLALVNAIPEFNNYIKHLISAVATTADKLPDKVAHGLVHAGLYNLVTFLLHSRKRHDISHARSYMNSQNDARYSFKAWKESGNAIYHMNQLSVATKTKMPVLLVHGDKDYMTRITAIQKFQTLFNHAMLERLPKGGHFLPLEDAVFTARIVETFLS